MEHDSLMCRRPRVITRRDVLVTSVLLGTGIALVLSGVLAGTASVAAENVTIAMGEYRGTRPTLSWVVIPTLVGFFISLAEALRRIRPGRWNRMRLKCWNCNA
jgi:hypothetical protein